MNLPLHYDMSRSRYPGGVPVVDAENKIIAMACSEEAAAELVKVANRYMPFLHRIFGPPRDARQRAHDKWVWSR